MNRVILYCLVVLAAGLAFGCQPAAQTARPAADAANPVTTLTITEVPLDRLLPVLGTLYAKDEATLGAEVEGKVEKTLVEFGDRVSAGQVLALIDTSTYEAQAQQAEASMLKAKATASMASANLKRIQALTKDQVAAPSELDQSQAAYDQGQAELKAAQAGLSLSKLNMDKSQVRAPFDAAIAERIASAGDYVKIGSPLFRVVNDNVLKFIVQAPERYAGQIKKDQPIQFTVDAWTGEQFTGKIFLISPAVNTSTRAFALGALVDNRDRRLKANTFARGEITLAKAMPSILIPIDAVLQSSGNSKVFVMEGGVARARQVDVGRVVQGKQEILSGLKAGEILITSGHYRLIDGAPVKVRPAAEATRPEKSK